MGKEGRASLQKDKEHFFLPLVSEEGKHIGMEGREVEGIQADVLDIEVNW